MSTPPVIEVVGELDLSTVAHWEATVGRAARSTERVVLDVSRVEFLDSAGVHALFRILTTLQGQQKRLVIVAPAEGRLRRVIEILDLPSLASVCDSLDEALRSEAGADPALAGRRGAFADR